jgi:hypothetical protein
VLLFINEIKFDRTRLILCVFIILILSLLFGFRGFEVGVDTINYIDFFRNESPELGIREPLFYLFKIIDNFYIFRDFSFGLMVVSFLINFLLLITFKIASNNYPGIFALYISTFLYLNMNINIIRQGLAISLIALAIVLVVKKRKSVKFWIIGCLTHYSAVVAIFPAMFFLKLRFDVKIKLFATFLIWLLIYFVGVKSLLLPFVEYSDAVSNAYWLLTWDIGREWNLKHIYYLILFLLLFSFFIEKKYNRKKNNENHIFISLLLLSFLIASIFKSDEMFADRIFYYFIFLVPIIIYNSADTVSNKYMSFPIILVGCNAWLFKTLFIQFPDWFIPPYNALS